MVSRIFLGGAPLTTHACPVPSEILGVEARTTDREKGLAFMVQRSVLGKACFLAEEITKLSHSDFPTRWTVLDGTALLASETSGNIKRVHVPHPRNSRLTRAAGISVCFEKNKSDLVHSNCNMYSPALTTSMLNAAKASRTRRTERLSLVDQKASSSFYIEPERSFEGENEAPLLHPNPRTTPFGQ